MRPPVSVCARTPKSPDISLSDDRKGWVVGSIVNRACKYRTYAIMVSGSNIALQIAPFRLKCGWEGGGELASGAKQSAGGTE